MRPGGIAVALLLSLPACDQRATVSGDPGDAGGDGPGRLCKSGAAKVYCQGDADCPAGLGCAFLADCIFCGGFWDASCTDTGKGKQCGVCLPAGPCASNADCCEYGYCHLAAGCKAPGECRPRPGGCYLPYSLFCGCDGRHHATDCSAMNRGITPVKRGSCQPFDFSCAGIEKALRGVLDMARSCNADKECSREVPDTVYCACSKTRVVAAKLDVVLFTHLILNAGPLQCAKPGCTCNKPTGARCVAGMCQDIF